jgi:subtilisin family serine protease
MSTASNRQTNYGIRNLSGAAYGGTYVCNLRVSSVDVDIQEMIDAGITVCIAAGNRSFKIDEATGTDYNNSMVADGDTIYYHRGSSPYDDDAIMVGSLDSTVYSSTLDQKATYSETGPGVHIWAPGTDIMSACSNTNNFGASNYHLNSAYKQMNISGTSMATPQVAGIVALLYEVNPKATPSQIKAMLLANAGTAVYSTGLANDWTSTRSLQGSLQKVVYNKFNSEKTLSIGGGVSISATVKIK